MNNINNLDANNQLTLSIVDLNDKLVELIEMENIMRGPKERLFIEAYNTEDTQCWFGESEDDYFELHNIIPVRLEEYEEWNLK